MDIYKFDSLRKMSNALTSPEVCVVKHLCTVSHQLHGHDYYEIEYISEGNGVQIINGKTYRVKAGSIIFFRPGDVHSYYSSDSMMVYNCCVRNRTPFRYFPSDADGAAVIELDGRLSLETEQLFFLLETELSEKDLYRQDAVLMLTELILLVLVRNNSKRVPADTYWGKLLKKIASDYMNITLSEAAELMGFSTRHFSRLFKNSFGKTFHEYITSVRIQEAKRRLIGTSMSVEEISRCVGYANPRRFFIDFKAAVGTTPLCYRKESENYAEDVTESF